MSTKQALSVPKLFLDDYQNDYLAMVSEHVLIEMTGRISFFHESFFDYCFARRFFTKGKKISDFLKDGEQHLFKRAQVRQILLLQRSNDFPSFCQNVQDLLIDPAIRFHIKEVVASILSNISDPKTEELDIVLKTISEGEYEISGYLFQTISRSHDWFDLFQTRQIITTWLNSGKQADIDLAITFCNKVSRIRSEMVAMLLMPKISLSTEWDNRICYILFYTDVSCSEKMFILLLKCVDTEFFASETSHSRDLNHVLYSLKEQMPGWACKVLSLHFNKFYEKHPLKDEDRGL